MTPTIATEAAGKPRVKLAGTAGNGFALLAAAFRAAQKAGWTAERIDAFKAEATKAGYTHLLDTMQRYFEVE